MRLETSDGIRLAAEYHAPRKAKPVFVLLHGLGAGRGEWAAFASTLAARGYGTLALDARGHGESGGPPFTTFATPESWLLIERDLEAALSWLAKRGVPARRAVLAGASIGANIALRTAARRPSVPFVVLLSAGYDYQGVRIEDAAARFERPILFAAAAEDPYAFRTAALLAPRARHPESLFLKAAAGHGAGMLSGAANAAFLEELLRAIERLSSAKPASSGGAAGDKRASP